jgi:hypothetical protein
MSNIFRHRLVFLEFLEEHISVEVPDVLDVAEDDVLLALDAGGDVAVTPQLLEEHLDADVQVFDVRSFGLQQFSHYKSAMHNPTVV